MHMQATALTAAQAVMIADVLVLNDGEIYITTGPDGTGLLCWTRMGNSFWSRGVHRSQMACRLANTYTPRSKKSVAAPRCVTAPCSHRR
jgi:hypothetical protein